MVQVSISQETALQWPPARWSPRKEAWRTTWANLPSRRSIRERSSLGSTTSSERTNSSTAARSLSMPILYQTKVRCQAINTKISTHQPTYSATQALPHTPFTVPSDSPWSAPRVLLIDAQTGAADPRRDRHDADRDRHRRPNRHAP